MKQYLTRYFILIGLIIFNSAALASSATTDFLVTAQIENNCTVSANALPFGSYIYTADSDQITLINVTCTAGTTYNIGLDAGLSGGSTSTRKMRGTPATNTLDYFLYSDPGRNNNWGDIVGTDTVSGIGNSTTQGIIVYGRIPSGQNTASVDSTYADTITVTVNF